MGPFTPNTHTRQMPRLSVDTGVPGPFGYRRGQGFGGGRTISDHDRPDSSWNRTSLLAKSSGKSWVLLLW